MKTCIECKEEKNEENFQKRGRGYSKTCSVCVALCATSKTEIHKSNCRKCGGDYYYILSHLDDRCGEDICHTCVSLRKLTRQMVFGRL